MKRISFDDLRFTTTKEMIKNQESFEVTGCGGKMGEAAKKVEDERRLREQEEKKQREMEEKRRRLEEAEKKRQLL